MKDEYTEKLIEEQSKIPYNILWYMINIPKEKVKEICERDDHLLILYFLIKECGADKKWKETKESYDKSFDPKNESTWYICDSQYESYFRFEDLVKKLKFNIGTGIEGKYFSYVDYIEEHIKK